MRIATVFVLVLCFSAPARAQSFYSGHPQSTAPAQAESSADVVPGEFIVKFRAGSGVLAQLRSSDALSKQGSLRTVGNASLDALGRRLGLQSVHTIRAPLPSSRSSVSTGAFALVKMTFPANVDAEAVLQAYRDDPLVAYVEPNYRYGIAETIPGDPDLAQQWAFHNEGQTGGTADADIDAVEAWDIQRGDSAVIVAVIDTGVDWQHEDLADNMWVNAGEIPGNDVDDDANGYVDDIYGWDFFANDSDPDDESGHGTHVAGTIGAVGDNGIGVTGTAWRVRLMALRFLGPGGGDTADAVDAIYYAEANGAHIMNNSWGGGGASLALEEAIDFVTEQGVFFAVAAGNDDSEEPDYPSSYENSFVVASTDHSDVRSSFSNYGTWVEIAAPGSDIYSTLPNDKYGSLSGTSMACPHVAGLAALLLAENPDWTVEQLRTHFTLTTDNVDETNGAYLGKLGAGRINAHQALLPAEPRLQVADLILDDDQFGASQGNVDGLLNAGETIELRVELQNVGAVGADAVEARLTSDSPLVTLSNTSAGYGAIGGIGGSAEPQTSFLVAFSPSAQTGDAIDFDLFIEAGGGLAWHRTFTLTVREEASASGRVLDRRTGSGIAGARVEFDGPVTDFSITEEDGSFRLPDLIDGTYTFTASHPDYEGTDEVTVSLPPSRSDLELSLGNPDVEVSPGKLEAIVDWGTTERHTVSLTNSGFSTLHYDLFELPSAASGSVDIGTVRSRLAESFSERPAGADDAYRSAAPFVQAKLEGAVSAWTRTTASVPAVKVAVLDSWGTGDPRAFQELNASWDEHGSIPVLIDHSSLDKDNITYEDLVDADADVLVVSLAYRKDLGWEFKGAEQAAIDRYLSDGHGLVVTGGTLHSENVSGHVPFFARLLGLNESLYYDVTKEARALHAVKPSAILRKVPDPYLPGIVDAWKPELGSWEDAVVDAEIIAATTDNEIAVTALGRNVYISSIPEVSRSADDLQLLYNAFIHAGLDVPWLALDRYEGTTAVGASADVEVELRSLQLNPSRPADARLLLVTNDVDRSQVEVPITAELSGSAAVRTDSVWIDDAAGNGDGFPSAGEQISVHMRLTNEGPVSASDVGITLSALHAGVTAVDGSAQVDQLSAGSSAEVAFLVDIASFLLDREPAVLEFTIQPNGSTSWTHAERLTVRRLNTVTGVVVGGGSDRSIHYVGDESGSIQVKTDGSYVLALPDGTYDVWASSPGFPRSAYATTTLPSDETPLDFSLASGRLAVSEDPIVLSLNRGDDSTVSVTVTNTGDGSLSVYADAVQDTVESRLYAALEGAQRASRPDLRVALIQSVRPQGSTLLEDLLRAHGIAFDILAPGDLAGASLDEYQKVFVPSAQPPEVWGAVASNVDRLEQYVENGGVLHLHTFLSSPGAMPGGLATGFGSTENVDVVRAEHPFLNDPVEISESMLEELDPTTFDYFLVVPPASTSIIEHAEKQRPVLIESVLGSGVLIATTLNLHGQYTPLGFVENLVLYQIARPDWLQPSQRGAVIAAGGSADFDLAIGAPSVLPGRRVGGMVRFRSSDPLAPIGVRHVELAIGDAPAIAVEGVRVDGNGILKAGEQASLYVMVRNVGTLDLASAVAELVISQGDASVVAALAGIPSLTVQSSAEIGPFTVDVSSDAADDSRLGATLEVSGDGFEESVAVPEIRIASDSTPPNAVTDLSVFRSAHNTIVLALSSPGLDDDRAVYDVRYSTQPITASNFAAAGSAEGEFKPAPSGQTYVPVHGLQDGTLYHFAVKVVDGAGNESTMSNTVSGTPQRVIRLDNVWWGHGFPRPGADAVLNPGEDPLFMGDVVNASGTDLPPAFVEIDTTYDAFLYTDSRLYDELRLSIGPLAPGASAFFYQTVWVSAEAPDGHVLELPLVVSDAAGRYIDSDTIRVEVIGVDTAAPVLRSYRTYGQKNIGDEIQFGTRFGEAGLLRRAQAIVETSQGEIARVDLNDDGRGGDGIPGDLEFGGRWVVDRSDDIRIRMYAEDASGNVMVETVDGFSSEGFVGSRSNLLIYDDIGGHEPEHLAAVQAQLTQVGFDFDTWNTFYKGPAPPSALASYRSGLVFLLATNVSTFQHGFVVDAFQRHMNLGGDVVVFGDFVAEDLSRTSSSTLASHFGARVGARKPNVGKLFGTGSVGGGLELTLTESITREVLEPTDDAIPLLRFKAEANLGATETGAHGSGRLRSGSRLRREVRAAADDTTVQVVSLSPYAVAPTPTLPSSDVARFGGMMLETAAFRSAIVTVGWDEIVEEPSRDSLVARVIGWTSGGGSDTTPAQRVLDLSASLSSHNFAEVSWTAPSGGAEGKAAARYEIRYSNRSPGSDRDSWWRSAVAVSTAPDPGLPGEPQRLILKDLSGPSNYYVALKAFNAAGSASPLSNVATATVWQPPAAAVSADRVALEVAGGDSTETIIEIANDGEGALLYQVRFEPTGETPGRGQLSDTRFLIVDHGLPKADFTDGSYDLIDEFSLPELSIEELERYDGLYAEAEWVEAEIPAMVSEKIGEYAARGGVAVISARFLPDGTVLDATGIQFMREDQYGVPGGDMTHPWWTGEFAGGTPLPEYTFADGFMSAWGTLRNVPDHATIIVETEEGPTLVEYRTGAGRVMVTSLALFGSDLEQLVRYAKYAASQHVTWFRARPVEGTIAPHSTGSVAVVFDGEDIPTGSYDVDVRIETNDPDRPVLRVPVSVDVAGSPSTAVEGVSELPEAFALDPPYPNPFNPATTVRFAVPRTSDVRVEVYDALGRRVATLHDGEIAPGYHEMRWMPHAIASGVYFIRMRSPMNVHIQSVVLVR